MSEVRIYVEGGGADRDGKRAIREGFRRFFRNRQVQVIACGSRDQARDAFKFALRSHPEVINLLLVDSEKGVSTSPWEHLMARDGWERPTGASDAHCHLMVQTVESWLVADPDALASFYGQGFLRKALPANTDIEAVPKADVMKKLEHATARTQKGRYHKIDHCSELLARLDPERVRRRARHCDRLLRVLDQLLSGEA